MKTIFEIAKSYQGNTKKTVYEAVQQFLHGEQAGCQTHDKMTDKDLLKVGDLIKVSNKEESSWNNQIGTIQSLEVTDRGTQMWFIGYHGYLFGCTIQKLCPECQKELREFKF